MAAGDELRDGLNHGLVVGRKEERNCVALLSRIVHDTVASRDIAVIRQCLQLVPNVDDERSWFWRCRNPLACLIRNLKSANRPGGKDGEDWLFQIGLYPVNTFRYVGTYIPNQCGHPGHETPHLASEVDSEPSPRSTLGE